jgi:hypothetical protein
MYGDGRDEPPTELELEEERAGYAPQEPVDQDEAFNSPLWIAGIRPGGRRQPEPAPGPEDADSDEEPEPID